MRIANFLTFGVLSLSLMSLSNACKSKEFKGSTATRSAKSNNATPEKSGDSTPDSPTMEGEAEEPVIPNILAPEIVEVPRIVQKPISIVNTFWASISKQASFSFSLDTKATSTTFKLTDNNGSKSQSHSQNTRTLTTDSFKQGTVGSPMTQTFEQKGKKGLIDILIVVDNSGSMDVEQKNLSTKLSSLLTFINGSNWQIGVVTTDATVYNGACKMTLIRSTDADAETKFKAATTPGITGSGAEQGVRQAVVGLGCSSSPWLRNDASTAVLIVSDEDNCSKDGADCGTEAWAKESYLIDYVEKTLKKEFWKNFGIYGIFSLPSAPCNVAGNVGVQYQRLMNHKNTNGAHKNAGDICASDYSTILNEISKDIALLLDNQFELSATPDSNPVKLSVDGTQIPSANYTISGKTITFKAGKEPTDGKKLVVEYNVGAIPQFKAVALKNAPVAGTLAVKVGSKTLASNEYTLSNRDLTFNVQPADLSAISIDYRIEGPMINAFQLEKSPLANTLKVTVDGKAATGMTYDGTKNQIVFNPVPGDGASVLISYDYRIGPNLTYTVASAAGSSNHKVFDGATEISATKNGDSYTIKSENHSLNKVLTLKYDAPDGSVRNFDLPNEPSNGTVQFVKDVATCKFGNGITISGKRVSANCAVAAKSDFEMSYLYAETYDTFSMDVPNPEKGIWEVRLDGVKFDYYTRSGNTIHIDFAKYLNVDSVIEVRYTYSE